MNQELLEQLVNKGLDKGADFSEIFYEDKKEININLASSIIDECNIKNTKGVGIRLAKDKEVYYACTNNLDADNLNTKIDELNLNFNTKRIMPKISLKKEEKLSKNIVQDFTTENLNMIKNKLYKYDKYARSLDSRIIQFNTQILGIKQNVTIANSKGKLVEDERILTRFYFKIIVKENERTEFAAISFASSIVLETIDDNKILKLIEERTSDAIEKLKSIPCPGGEIPVIISNMGGTLMHEACGHALEATMVSDGTSILSNKMNTQIASEKVTLIDDGTMKGEWGSNNYDDEGNKTNKNILIQNGILKKYLVDEINSRIMPCGISGSGRREDFSYAPTSRMNNTYLANGTDKVEDMIKSIKYGLYAKTIGGGQVNPTTGDFTFAVLDAYMIRDGKIAEPVKGASLVGNTEEILKNIEMVGDDLFLCPGLCGSLSGWVPVTTGQPTVKISKILVGGENNGK